MLFATVMDALFFPFPSLLYQGGVLGRTTRRRWKMRVELLRARLVVAVVAAVVVSMPHGNGGHLPWFMNSIGDYRTISFSHWW